MSADAANNKIRKIVISAGPTARSRPLRALRQARPPRLHGGHEHECAIQFADRYFVRAGGPPQFCLSPIRSIKLSGRSRRVARRRPSLFAGTPNTGTPFSNGLATSATFSIPTGVATSSTTAYVVDTNNKVVRTIAAASAPAIGGGGQPSPQTVAVGNTATFHGFECHQQPPASYQWQRSTDSGGTWNALSNGAITGGTISGATAASLFDQQHDHGDQRQSIPCRR